MVKNDSVTYWWLFSESRKRKLWRTEISPYLHREFSDIIRLIRNSTRWKDKRKAKIYAIRHFESMIKTAVSSDIFDDFMTYILYHSLHDSRTNYRGVMLDLMRRLTSKF